jgi:hypothetical protein
MDFRNPRAASSCTFHNRVPHSFRHFYGSGVMRRVLLGFPERRILGVSGGGTSTGCRLQSQRQAGHAALQALTSLHCGQLLYLLVNKPQTVRTVFTRAALQQALGILKGRKCGSIVVPVLVYFG